MKNLINKIHCADCLDFMAKLPDKCIDLIVTDPPYGIGIAKNGTVGGGCCAKLTNFGAQDWDMKRPDKKVFDEMFRISKNQIIFGGNYFADLLPPSPCWIVWNKDNGKSYFADCELAWASFKTAVRLYKYRWNGMLQENMKNKEKRFHPTQKPVVLMSQITEKYSTPTDIIFDPFAGSGSTLVAAERLGRDWIGCELSEEYCDIARTRIHNERNGRLFDPRDNN